MLHLLRSDRLTLGNLLGEGDDLLDSVLALLDGALDGGVRVAPGVSPALIK